MAGLDNLDIPQVTIDLQYDIAQAEADLHAYTQIDGVAAVDLTADLPYLWFNADAEMDNPSH